MNYRARVSIAVEGAVLRLEEIAEFKGKRNRFKTLQNFKAFVVDRICEEWDKSDMKNMHFSFEEFDKEGNRI